MRGACDCHVHLYAADDRWAATRPAVARADLPAYRDLQPNLHTDRVVIVQPLLYGHDNGLMLEMLRELGPARARGIAIAAGSISDGDLDDLRAAGVAGLRFFVGTALKRAAGDDAGTLAQMRSLAPRLRGRGMHLQVNTNGRFLERHAQVFDGLACGIVFDHLGHVLPDGEGGFTGLPQLLGLLQQGNAWVKISGLYLDSQSAAAGCEDMRAAVQRLAGAFPNRLVWGSNWPHPTVHLGDAVPDDPLLLDQAKRWLHDAQVQQQVLIKNAEALYGFVA